MSLRCTFVGAIAAPIALASSVAAAQPPAAISGSTVASSQAAGASAPIQDPVTVPVASSASLPEVYKAVLAALMRRGWTVADEKPRYLEAVIDKPGQFVARIGVAYDASHVAIRYVTSQGLSWDPAAHTIDAEYNKWVRGLSHEIEAGLGGGTPTVAHTLKPPVVTTTEAPPAATPVAGATIRIRPGTAIRGRPAIADAGTPAQAPVVTLKAPIQNAEGRWWYVASGGQSGWIQEKDLGLLATR